jgi:hypothetical protein
MERSSGVSFIMNKTIIYKLVGVVGLMILGEGIFGWPLYWLGLWFLLDWQYVYWLAFVLGFLLTGVTGMAMGWSNLMLVAGVWLMNWLKKIIGGYGKTDLKLV